MTDDTKGTVVIQGSMEDQYWYDLYHAFVKLGYDELADEIGGKTSEQLREIYEDMNGEEMFDG